MGVTTVDYVPLTLKTVRGEDAIVNAKAVVMLTPIGLKTNPQCNMLLLSGQNIAFAGSAQEINAAILAVLAGKPAPPANENLPPDLRTPRTS